MAGLALEGAEVSGVPLAIVALAGAAVVLAGVAAVRVSSRLGLPSLLLYLGIGVAIGEAGLGHPVRRRGAHRRPSGSAALVVILAEGGLTTRWTAVRPALRLGRRAVHARGAVSVAVVAGAALHCCWTPTGGPALLLRRGALVDRRGRGVLHPAPARLPARLTGDPGGRVRHQRRPGRAPGDPAVQRRDRVTWSRSSRWSSYELVAGAAIGLAVGFGAGAGCCAGPRCRRPGSTRSPIARRHRGSYALGDRSRTRPASSPCTSPALVLGNVRPAAPARHARLRRRAGLAGPDRAVRAARAAASRRAGWVGAAAGAGRRGGAGAAGPAAVGARVRGAGSGSAGASRRSCPGRVCAGRCRSCWPRSR